MEQEEKEQKKGYYAVIPANVRYDKNLPANAKLLYGEITALCNEKGYCWANNKYFMKLYDVSIKTITRWLKALKDANYINILINKEEGNTRIITINTEYTSNANTYTQKCQYLHAKMTIPTRKNDNTYKRNVNNTINTTEDNNPATDLQSQAIAVLSTSSDSNMGTEINALIKEFEPINPSFRRLYPNKTQRAALERLVQQHGKMKIEELIRILPQTNQMKYLPTITTPLQLEEKLGQLIAGIKKVKLNKPTVAKIK